jgi:hypothetical protein
MRGFYQITLTFPILQFTFKMAATIRKAQFCPFLTDLQARRKMSSSIDCACHSTKFSSSSSGSGLLFLLILVRMSPQEQRSPMVTSRESGRAMLLEVASWWLVPRTLPSGTRGLPMYRGSVLLVLACIILSWLPCHIQLASVGTNPGIESGGFDSFGDFCGRVKSLNLKVKESIPNRHDFQTKVGKKDHFNPKFWYLTEQKKFFEPHLEPPTAFLWAETFQDHQKCIFAFKTSGILRG